MTKILLETNNKDAAFDNAIGSYDTESKCVSPHKYLGNLFEMQITE